MFFKVFLKYYSLLCLDNGVLLYAKSARCQSASEHFANNGIGKRQKDETLWYCSTYREVKTQKELVFCPEAATAKIIKIIFILFIYVKLSDFVNNSYWLDCRKPSAYRQVLQIFSYKTGYNEISKIS